MTLKKMFNVALKFNDMDYAKFAVTQNVGKSYISQIVDGKMHNKRIMNNIISYTNSTMETLKTYLNNGAGFQKI